LEECALGTNALPSLLRNVKTADVSVTLCS
jgi:hypothetical protein